MNERPKRRWFGFSLRTLFVVMTLIAVWLGWQASIVRERKALIAEGIENHMWLPVYSNKPYRTTIRTLMGDEPVEFITVFEDNSLLNHPLLECRSRLEEAFPEATIYSWQDW